MNEHDRLAATPRADDLLQRRVAPVLVIEEAASEFDYFHVLES